MPVKQPPEFVGVFTWKDDGTQVTDFLAAYKKNRSNLFGEKTDQFFGFREVEVTYKPQDPNKMPDINEKPVITLKENGRTVEPISLIQMGKDNDMKWYGEFEMKQEILAPIKEPPANR